MSQTVLLRFDLSPTLLLLSSSAIKGTRQIHVILYAKETSFCTSAFAVSHR
jgi:hypothetical protein